MKHKHLTDEEILKYIKKKGKIKEIDKRILECSECFEKFKHIFYRERFLKEQAQSRKKDFFKKIYGNLMIKGEKTKPKLVRLLGGNYIKREFEIPSGKITVIMGLMSITFQFQPTSPDLNYFITVYKGPELIAESKRGELKVSLDIIKNSIVSIICNKEHFGMKFDEDIELDYDKWGNLKN